MTKVHEYCCCAIPLLNVGIYLTILEQFVVGLLGGILSIATPPLVGTAIPGFAQWIFAIGCFVVCATQALGFIGVFKEKASLFQRFVQLNAAAISFVFGVAGAFIIVSATRHTTATDNCVNNFFAADNSTTASSNSIPGTAVADDGQGQTVCNIFTWVDVGLMGGFFLVMLIFQGYLIIVTSWYGKSQLADHSKYYSIYSVTAPEGINLGERQNVDAWDPRPSTDSWSGGQTRPAFQDHSRQNSEGAPYGVAAGDYKQQPTYGYQDETPQRKNSDFVNQPHQAYTNDTEPTPVALTSPENRYQPSTNYYGAETSSGPSVPVGAMYPNEGQFGRKTPRTEDQGYNYNKSNDYAFTAPAARYAPSDAPSYHTEQAQYYPQR